MEHPSLSTPSRGLTMSEADLTLLTQMIDLQESEHDVVSLALISGAIAVTLAMVIGLRFL
jgi:DUF4097 and DUF4098 domain-containing protein YvlB